MNLIWNKTKLVITRIIQSQCNTTEHFILNLSFGLADFYQCPILTSALCIQIQFETNTMKVKFEYEMNQFNCLKLAAFLNNSLSESAYIVLLNQAVYWYSC